MSTRTLIAGFAFLFLTADATREAGPATLAMHVVPTVSSNNNVSLHFRLRYDGWESFEADVGTLPGVQPRFTVTLVADRFPDLDSSAADKPCTSLKDIITINEPSPGWRVVSPGQQFVEDIPLSDLYTGIEGAIGRCEIVVNWSYKMYTRDKVRFSRMAGSVVIPTNLRPVVPPDTSVHGYPWKYKAEQAHTEVPDAR